MAKPNTGSISANKRKEKETHPDISGSITVDAPGTYWVSGWKKQGDDGIWYSLALKPKEESRPQRQETVEDDGPPF